MLTFFLVVLGLALLIIGHEAGHFAAARFFKLKVEEFGFGFPPRIFAKRKGETEYSLNWVPFGGFVKIAGENGEFALAESRPSEAGLPEEDKKRFLFAQPAWKRSAVLLAGVAVNFLIGWLLLSIIFSVGTPPVLLISGVQPASPAEQVGLRAGDVISGYSTAKAFTDFVNAHRGEEISIPISRGGKAFAARVTPRVKTGEHEGAVGVLLAEGGVARMNPLAAVWNGLRQSIAIIGLTVGAFYELAKNLLVHGTLVSDVVGPVGIFSVAQESSRIGFIYFVQLLSLISLNLAVVNLIPFPALDGGRFLLVLIEKLKGSPVPKRFEILANGLGFIILILLMGVLTIRDIHRLLQ